MGRILAIDFGMKRIGLARSDSMKIIASPYKTILAEKNLEATANLILQEIEDVELIVLGLPLLLSGQDSETTKQVRAFASCLEKKMTIPLLLWDERLTSKQVEKLMSEKGVKRKNRSSHVDQLSATLILQSYLDASR